MSSALEEHHGYLADATKIARYQSAIDKAVTSGQTVLDLGCGSGVLGLMALRAGAGKAYFVEEGVIIEAARRTVTTAGFADRAEFLQSNSFQLELPERVDVILCDHVGYFGIDYGILDLLSDARQRFLKPGGVMIPTGFTLKLAPVEADDTHDRINRWLGGRVPEDFAWLVSAAANTKHAVNLAGSDLLAEAADLATIVLGDEIEPFLTWNAEFQCTRDGRMDGVIGWFDCKLIDDVRMTNSPAADDALERPQAFLPLEAPVSVAAGETVAVTVMARHRDNILGWIVELPQSGQRFAQTTFNGLFLDSQTLTRAHPDRTAELNERGEACKLILAYCDGSRTVAEVQALVQQKYPNLFPTAFATEYFVTAVLAENTGK